MDGWFVTPAVWSLVALCAWSVARAGGEWAGGRPNRGLALAGSYAHEQGDGHLLGATRDPRGDSRGRSRRRSLYRTGAVAGRGRQYLQGPRVQSTARHAVGVR